MIVFRRWKTDDAPQNPSRLGRGISLLVTHRLDACGILFVFQPPSTPGSYVSGSAILFLSHIIFCNVHLLLLLPVAYRIQLVNKTYFNPL